MSTNANRLVSLLPAVYGLRDAETDGSLAALLAVIEQELAVVEENLAQLYDDQFVETCAEWVLPYLGDLIGAQPLAQTPRGAISQRAYIANTLSYRRRKGTAAVLEQLARDVTGWPARTVEFFQLLATSQHLNHPRPGNRVTVDLRRMVPLERIGGPFEEAAHTAEVRRIEPGLGRYDVRNVGIFLWRLAAHPLTNSPAVRVDPDATTARRFRMSPLGGDVPLFARGQAEDEITHLAEPVNVPEPLRLRTLTEKHLLAGSDTTTTTLLTDYYGPGKSLFLTVTNEEGTEPEADTTRRVTACDLSDDPVSGDWAHLPAPTEEHIAVDPLRGRIALPASLQGSTVHVTFHTGFSADMGGGEYPRPFSDEPDYRVGADLARNDFATIGEAVEALGTQSGIIEITDNGHYAIANKEDDAEIPEITLIRGQSLTLRAADGVRPMLTLSGILDVTGKRTSRLTLDGLLIAGGALRAKGKLAALDIGHCTLVPGQQLDTDGTPLAPTEPSLIVVPDGAAGVTTEVTIDHSICGPLRLPADGCTLTVRDSIVDSPVRGGPARQRPVLVSAPLTEPLALSALAALNVRVGNDRVRRIHLIEAPSTIADAAAALEAALQTVIDNPAYAAARVLAIDARLVILPAGDEPITVLADPNDATALTLGLTHQEEGGAHRVAALAGGAIPEHFPVFTPTLQVTIGQETPRSITAGHGVENRDAAHDAMQELIGREAPEQIALVAMLDSGLLIVPLRENGEAIVFDHAPGDMDRVTLGAIGLETARPAIAASAGGEVAGPPLMLERSTVLGAVTARQLSLVSDCIVTGALVAERRHEGCLRYSFVGAGSRTPRQYNCLQPAAGGGGMVPIFTSRRFTAPGYCQLGRACPRPIREGASDGAEMGAFHDLYQPQREANLRGLFAEHLRYGLAAGLFFVT